MSCNEKPFPFTEQPDKWGYLNNPRWTVGQSIPVNYDGRESEEPQIWTPEDGRLPVAGIQHNPCGHWHKNPIGGIGGEMQNKLYAVGQSIDCTPPSPCHDYRWSVISVDTEFNLRWTWLTIHTTPYGYATCIWPTDSLIYVGGLTDPPGETLSHIVPAVYALDDNGNTVYSVNLSSGATSTRVKAIITDNSGVYIAWEVTNTSTRKVTKYNLDLTTKLWEITIPNLYWSNFSTPPNHFTIDDTGLYIGGCYSSGGIFFYVAKLNLTDGSIIWQKTENPTPDNITAAYIICLTQDDTYIYGGGFTLTDSDMWKWYVERRNKSDGTLNWYISDYPKDTSVYVASIDIIGNNLFTAGTFVDAALSYNRIEKRSLTGSFINEWVEIITVSEREGCSIVANSEYIYEVFVYTGIATPMFLKFGQDLTIKKTTTFSPPQDVRISLWDLTIK